MTQNNDVPEFAVRDESDMISLAELFLAVWNARWLVLGITLLVGACGVAWSHLHTTYRSEGFFQFGASIPVVSERRNREASAGKESEINTPPGIVLANYKRYAASYGTSERFAEFVRQRKLAGSPGVAEVAAVFASREGILKYIEPIYTFTKSDAKELMEQPKDASNNVIGLRFSYEDRSPEVAQKSVGMLGEYVMDSIVYFIYEDELRSKHDDLKTRIGRIDNDIIRNKLSLEAYRRRAMELKAIVARNPAAANSGGRQVVSVNEDNARYLPPTTLLVTSEVQAMEANENILRAKSIQVQNKLYLEYYDAACTLMDGTKSGFAVLRGLESVKEAVFKNKDLNDDVVKEVYNAIAVDNQTASGAYMEKSRFIAGPTYPQRSTARPVLTLALGLMLGFFLSLIVVIARSVRRSERSSHRSAMADTMGENAS